MASSLTFLLLQGCTAQLVGDSGEQAPAGVGPNAPGTGGSSAAGGGGGGPTGPIAELDCSSRVIDPGPSPMRLLSRRQYLATVRDLAGDVPDLDAALGGEVEASAFGLLQPDVTLVQLEGFQKAADVVARAVVSSPEALDRIAPCASGTAPEECAKSLVTSFGARAYRAPVTDAQDIERHVQLFNVGAVTSYQHGVEMLLRGMLQSPRFLYRVELGTGERVSERAVKLAPHEIAARLSYRVWGTLPDAALNDAVASGALATQEGVVAQLERMLADARGGKLVNRFLESWTHLGALESLVKSPEAYPEFQSPTFKASLRGQAAAFFDHLLLSQGGKLGALFTSQTVFYNADLGAHYGLTGGDAFQATQRDDGTASGILTLPALLAITGKPGESSPIYRGRFVREALLCQQLPAPPADIPPAPEVSADSSTRERANQHQANPACSGCHQLLDPIGFAFENYDTLGRYRTTDGGKPVDASGNLIGTRDIDGPFNGVVELGAKLASSAEVEECVTRQWFRFAIERFEQDFDGCSVKSVLDAFQAAGQDLNALPKAIVETDAFLYRRPLDAQVTP